MFKTIEAQLLKDTTPPALRAEFWQYDFERLRTYSLLVYCASVAIWVMFDLILSFQGGQGFTYKSVLIISAMLLHVLALVFIRKAQHFQVLNIVFAAIMALSIRLVMTGVLPNLHPAWLVIGAATILFSSSVMPLRRWSFFTTLGVTWAILNPYYEFDHLFDLRGSMTLCYISFVSGLVIYSYITTRRAKLQNFQMSRLLLQLAYLDTLTEIPNRRSFMTKAQGQIKKAVDARDHYLAMVDIDNFKKVNDQFGHDVGDIVLKRVAANIKASMPEFEFARLGGEEFAIYLWGLTQAEAERRVAALCLEVRSDPAQYPVTISIGLTHIEADDTLTCALIKADAALYDSKHTGKDKYTLHPGSAPVDDRHGRRGTGTQA
ncbi:GGDEF domain-containing protein [Pseudomonas akapageensis]|uniref:GGDEF domain-containing protein n=1 Tax=Pseudomonas akapageensis TaxID=2609961 RepID=UPI00140CAEC0|nr:GGDEF domain-containing protein [Pseudomonas akapageensis]